MRRAGLEQLRVLGDTLPWDPSSLTEKASWARRVGAWRQGDWVRSCPFSRTRGFLEGARKGLTQPQGSNHPEL